ncbi:MAG: lamin tail domain-containing protein [Dysgonamonadaceae bacterium]|nr:lamin tail domain-containing protein [Dysgonamonadaceae bacterium]
MKQKIIFGLLLFVCTLSGVWAQRTTFLKINEVLVINKDNFQDDYGNKFPWIEIYNASPGTVDIAGCFITNDINNPRRYPIPKGDVLTKIKPRQHVLFWADNMPTRGTFHVNFTLDPDQSNYIALFDSDGHTLIDSVTVPAGQRPDISYGLLEDGWSQKRLEEKLRLNSTYKEKNGSELWVYFEQVTPSSNNKILDTNERIEKFKKNDERGVGMTITAMAVVFIGLILLFLFFKLIGNIAVSLSHERAMKASGISKEEAKGIIQTSGDIYAAIAMAIYEATELHDEENTILTIKNTARSYSPWNSKIYTLRETPIKK